MFSHFQPNIVWWNLIMSKGMLHQKKYDFIEISLQFQYRE